MRYLKKHHMTHHFANPKGYFGVTSPLWDIVFGTLKQPERRTARIPQPSIDTRNAS
jgi:sterol desaturase/sphingolipid hydroxylase (fatty acid hydroxylase superfamily)